MLKYMGFVQCMFVALLVTGTLATINHARRDITRKLYDGTVCPKSIQLYGEVHYGVDSTYVDRVLTDSVSFVMVTVHGDTTLTEQDFDSVEVCGGFSNSGPVEISYYTIRVENGLGLPFTKYERWCLIRIPEMELRSFLVREG